MRGPFLCVRSSDERPKEHSISEPRINERIRVPEVRLVGPNGEQVGIVRVEDALRLAEEADLDLVEVAPDARPPVCKLMDFGKFKYETAQKARDARRNQANTVLKEIRFRLKIDPHDYGTKKGHVERFLKAGDKVKVMIMFRGREQSRPEMGMRLLQRLAEDVSELGTVESSPRLDGRNMTMVIAPTKRKADAIQEQRKARAERTREDAPVASPADGDRSAAAAPAPEPESVVEAPAAEQVAETATPATVEAPAAPAETRAEAVAPQGDDVEEVAEVSEPAPVSAPAKASAPAAKAPAAPRPATPRPAPRPASRPSEQAGTASTTSSAAPRPQAPRPAAPKPGAPRPARPAPRPKS